MKTGITGRGKMEENITVVNCSLRTLPIKYSMNKQIALSLYAASTTFQCFQLAQLKNADTTQLGNTLSWSAPKYLQMHWEHTYSVFPFCPLIFDGPLNQLLWNRKMSVMHLTLYISSVNLCAK